MSISGAITEVFGKELIYRYLPTLVAKPDCISVKRNSNIQDLIESHAWINKERLVVKPDQGIKRRGAEGLIKLDTDIEGAVEWIEELHLQDELSSYKHLDQFLVEPFMEHKSNEERYVAIYSELEHDVILFYNKGGVSIGDVDEKASRMRVPLNQPIKAEEIKHSLVQGGVPKAQKDQIANFIEKLFALYKELHFTLLEINPFVVRDKIHVLDLAAKLDVNAQPLCQVKWGDTMGWVKKLGREQLPQEKRVSDMDRVSVGNMKMTLLNKKGRIWTAISGGGISLLLGDTMAKMGCLEELACYSQTSGPLSSKEIYEFMKEIIDLMLEEKFEDGKVFITGSQALDFVTLMKLKKMQGEGLFKVLDEYKNKMREANITVVIRSTVGVVSEKNEKVPDELLSLGIPIYIFGGDVPVEELVNFALNRRPAPSNRPNIYRQLSIPTSFNTPSNKTENNLSPEEQLFTKRTKIVAVGMIPPAIQGIIDYDFICNKPKPMVAAIVRPHSRQREEQYLWGTGKVSIPVYEDVDQALASHHEVTVVANTAPGPYAYRASWMALQKSQIKCLILSIGDIPLKQIRELIILARQKGVMIIGPTVPKHGLQVNVFKPGAFRYNLLGDIGGPMLDVIDLQLHRPGSVVMLSKSGGLSTELCVVVSRNSDGLYLCISLGGGRYTGSSFMDHIKYLHDNPAVSLFLLIGEFANTELRRIFLGVPLVRGGARRGLGSFPTRGGTFISTKVGGLDEYHVCEALTEGQITKPVIAYCIGTSATHFQGEPAFFGHTGGGIDMEKEDAKIKNQALRDAGAIVPDCFDGIAKCLGELFDKLITEGRVKPPACPSVPEIPGNMRPSYRPPAAD